MKRYASLLLSIFALGAVIAGTDFWLNTFNRTLAAYRSPLADAALPAQTVDLPDRYRLIVVVASGLSQATVDSLDLPNYTQIAQTGASAVMQGVPPSYSQTSRMVLFTGASPETNGAPPIDRPLRELSLVTVDTLFARAAAAGLKSVLVGDADWRAMIPRNHLADTFFVDAVGPEADQIIFENALLYLADSDIDLLVVQFTQLVNAAPQGDGAVEQAARQLDEYLGQIHQSVDLGSTVLVILGDHGFVGDGGFGGSEPEVTRVPLLITGNPVAPGEYSDVAQTDVAPTLAVLLGVSPPTSAQGRILFELLRLDNAHKTAAQIPLTQQRVALAQAYISAITGGQESAPESLLDDLAQADAALAQNNISGAYQLAQLAQQHANTQMAVVRSQQIAAEQWPRLLAGGVVLLVWTVLLWRKRGRYAGVIVFCAIIAVGLYHSLYQLQGLEYSISSLTNLPALPYAVARRITIGLVAGGGIILLVLMLAGEEDWVTLLGTGYGFSVLVVYVYTLPLFWAFWQNGLTVTWHLPNVDVLFWQIIGIYEAMVAALLGLFLPWPIMLLVLFVNWVRRSLNKTQSRSEPDALPGLHL